MADRAEVERRFLALLRSYLDYCDENYPDGWEIDEFIFVYQMRFAPSAGEPLEPWHGGSRPGWRSMVAWSSSTESYWHDEALLAEAFRDAKETWLNRRDADDEEDEDEDDDATD